MRTFDAQKPLIFIHVPKTAGMAVRKIVQGWFPRRFYLHYHNEAKGKMPDLLPLASRKFTRKPPAIYGHFNKNRGFGIEDYYPEVTQFVTIIRDPFELAISNYFMSERYQATGKINPKCRPKVLRTISNRLTSTC